MNDKSEQTTQNSACLRVFGSYREGGVEGWPSVRDRGRVDRVSAVAGTCVSGSGQWVLARSAAVMWMRLPWSRSSHIFGFTQVTEMQGSVNPYQSSVCPTDFILAPHRQRQTSFDVSFTSLGTQPGRSWSWDRHSTTSQHFNNIHKVFFL